MRATPDSWSHLEHWAVQDGNAACILELRARVEVLEAASSEPTPNPSQSGSALVERVMGVLGHYGPGTARAARRPKPPSLKEQALDDFNGLMQELDGAGAYSNCANRIRRALEALPND